jgi:hypothetical protein
VNLRPSAPPVPLLFALLVLVAVAARFGAQTLAELSGDARAMLWGMGAMWVSLAGCGSWLLVMLVIAYVQLARPLPLPAAPLPAEVVQMATEVERVIYHPAGNDKVGWFLDASPEQWRAVYELTRNGKSNIVYNVIDGDKKPFSHPQLSEFRNTLVRAGLAVHNPKTGTVALNAAGRVVVNQFGTPPPPEKGAK